MTVMKGKLALMEMLRAEGVEYIFGNPGTSENPFMEALESYPDLKYILVTQEGVAVGMADGYARASGKTAFLNLHIETGLANGISLMHNAMEGGTSMVVTSCNKDIRELVHGRTDLKEMVKLFTKWTAEVTHPEQLPYMMRKAFNEAKTAPFGPTYLSFSANALDHEGEMDIGPSAKSFPRVVPDSRAVEEAARLLANAHSPAIVFSDRVAQSGASRELTRLAELLGAKVYSVISSEVNIAESHPQYLGGLRLGYGEGKKALANTDVVLYVGRMMSGYYMYSEPTLRYFDSQTKLIHMDIDHRDVGSIQITDVGMVCDPKVGLVDLADRLESGMSGSAREAALGRGVAIGAEKAKRKEAWQARAKAKWNNNPMPVERMMAEIKNALPEDAVIADDAVTSRDALHNTISFDEPGSVYGARGGSLGWGMGGVLGVKLALPDKPVVGIMGDGSAMMTVQGLWTAAVYNIPAVYVICNNGMYRVLKLNMNAYKNQIMHEEKPMSKYIGMDFPLPFDFAGIAESMGVHGRRITDPRELGPALEHALGLGKPALLDVVIDGSV